MGYKFTKLNIGDVIFKLGGFVIKKITTLLPQLSAPTISLTDTTLSIYDTSGGLAEEFEILVDGEVVKTVSVETEEPEVEMQTLTVINSNNPAETSSYTMPRGYTFTQFVGSEYDTSGGLFELYNSNPITQSTQRVKYKGYELIDQYGDGWVLWDTPASGTCSYIGESVTQILTVVNSNNTAETATFTMPIGWNFERFVGSEYDTSGGKFTKLASNSIRYNGFTLYDKDDMSEITQAHIASGTFYYAGERMTDLKGYTVTVPEGWTQQNLPSGGSDFDISGVVSGYSMYDLFYETEFDMLSMFEHDQEFHVEAFLNNSIVASAYSEFTLVITGGTDVTNVSLIRWLENNNATFEKTLISFTIDGTTYQAEEGMTWAEWVESEYNTVGAHVSNGDAIFHGDNTNFLSVYGGAGTYVHSTAKISPTNRYIWTTGGGSND
jgi:hypothetical protein